MSLRELFSKFIEEYNDELTEARKTGDYKRSWGELVRQDIPSYLREQVDTNIYKVKGSVGAGIWTDVPWIAVFDKRITSSAQRGVYIVYLLNKDTKELFLTLNQGATNVAQGDSPDNNVRLAFTGIASNSNDKTTDLLSEKASEIRDCIGNEIQLPHGEINTGSKAYDAGCIYFKKYDISSIPDDITLYADLLAFIKAYQRYHDIVYVANQPDNNETRSWLVTWNPQYYSFDHYEVSRSQIIDGKEFIEPWACANTHVKVGDRVYLLRLGTGRDNGIIASGYAVKESYLAPHYLPEKRENGEKIKKIDIRFDHMLDRNSTEFLSQETLSKMFPDQQWSPQISGIAIKSEYAKEVETLWQSFFGEWFPSLQEYDPGLSKEQWVEFLNNHHVFNSKRLSAFAALYAYGGSATMRELEEKYGRNSDFYRNVLGSISEKAVDYFKIMPCNQKNAKTWPCMFFGRPVGKDRLGNYEWRIRPELYDALTEINIMQYLEQKQPNGGSFTLPDSFNEPVSRRFINSLLAKPFVILTGNSGTGKTRIATRFAKYMKVQLEDGKNYELVSVGADWTDNTAILGYYNPMGEDGVGKYVETAILRLFIRARNNPHYPFFLILDEMNLSHVERYFADFLSHMETPETAFKIENYSEEEFTYPDNLFVIGTVNIDETTYMFSPKVLDRANVIEFKPDKENIFGLFTQQEFDDSIEAAAEETVKAFMALARKIRENEYSQDLNKESDAFRQVYDILEENGFEFAYRTVKEICRYIYAAYEIADNSGYKMKQTIDEQIVQKLLPKIHGNRRAIGDMLEKLEKLFKENQYDLSATKLTQMQRKLDNTQYVSFI